MLVSISVRELVHWRKWSLCLIICLDKSALIIHCNFPWSIDDGSELEPWWSFCYWIPVVPIQSSFLCQLADVAPLTSNNSVLKSLYPQLHPHHLENLLHSCSFFLTSAIGWWSSLKLTALSFLRPTTFNLIPFKSCIDYYIGLGGRYFEETKMMAGDMLFVSISSSFITFFDD